MASYISQYSHWHKLVKWPCASLERNIGFGIATVQWGGEYIPPHPPFVFFKAKDPSTKTSQSKKRQGMIYINQLRQRWGNCLVSWVLLFSDDSWLVRLELNSHSSGTAYFKNPNLRGPLLGDFTLSERRSFVGWQHRAALLFYDHFEQHQRNPEVMQQGRKLLIQHVIQHALDLRSAGLQRKWHFPLWNRGGSCKLLAHFCTGTCQNVSRYHLACQCMHSHGLQHWIAELPAVHYASDCWRGAWVLSVQMHRS